MTVAYLLDATRGLAPHQKTARVAALLAAWPAFVSLAVREAELLVQRDAEDASRLQEGILIAQRRGLLPPQPRFANWQLLLMDGLSPQEAARKIAASTANSPHQPRILLCGSSGVGKTTAVLELAMLLPRALVWSNGDAFRALTLLALEATGATGLLTAKQVAGIAWDHLLDRIHVDDPVVQIDHNGLESLAQLSNGVLRSPSISTNLPTVARETQSYVIAMANSFIQANEMRPVLVEGRKITLQFVHGNSFFELRMCSTAALGQRRAAQRILDLAQRQATSTQEISDEFIGQLSQ